jgi:hypothetical protein
MDSFRKQSNKTEHKKKKGAKASKQIIPKKQVQIYQLDLDLQHELMGIIKAVKLAKVGDKLEMFKLSDPDLKTVGVFKKDIPFWGARFAKGTQVPTFRLYVTPTNVTTDAGGATFTTVPINISALLNASDLINVFDEYRVVGGLLKYDADTGLTASRPVQFCFGLVDYGDTTALASFAEAAAYDTKKGFYSTPYVVDVKPKTVSWPLKFSLLPDQEWIPTATTTTVCTWKCYSRTAAGATATLGFVHGYVDVQFRGSD